MKLQKTVEGVVELFVPSVAKVTAKNPAFFNPMQIVNRDISVLLASCLLKKDAAVLDLLSATGVRAVRFAREVGLKNVFANDANPTAVKLIRKNSLRNKIKLKIFNLRAHEFLARKRQLNKKTYFDYVDIDPFGTPVPFLDAAVKALNPRGGILAVTATDTANLCGVNLNACRRLYQAAPMRGALQHEIGIRILLKKIIEAGAQYEIALTPIFVHSTLHYMRVYLRADSGAQKADEVLKNVGMFEGVGPVWLGRLWNDGLVEKMFGLALTKKNISHDTLKLLNTIKEESKILVFGFYDLHSFRPKQAPKMNEVISRLHSKGFAAARTHFSESGVRTNASLKKFKKLIN